MTWKCCILTEILLTTGLKIYDTEHERKIYLMFIIKEVDGESYPWMTYIRSALDYSAEFLAHSFHVSLKFLHKSSAI